MGIKIKFDGIDKIIADLDKLSDAKGLNNAMQQACALVERSAKSKAPKDTGALRRSITSEVKGGSTEITGTVSSPLEYAPYIEYGTGLFAENGGRKDVPWFYKDKEGKGHLTSGQYPRPYMRPALNENRGKVVEIIKGGLMK
jgi:HK97 gp10 family phage protein